MNHGISIAQNIPGRYQVSRSVEVTHEYLATTARGVANTLRPSENVIPKNKANTSEYP